METPMSSSRWKLWHKAVATAVLVSPGILGVSTAATAAPRPTAPVAVSAGSTNAAMPAPMPAQVIAPHDGNPATSIPEMQGEQRRGLSTFLNALKKIPALFNAVAQGAKKGWAWFRANVWPKVTATLGTITNLVTAWEIWQYFS